MVATVIEGRARKRKSSWGVETIGRSRRIKAKIIIEVKATRGR